MFLVLYVLSNVTFFEEIVDAWEKTGVQGITVLPSTGLGKIRQETALREDLPLFPSVSDFFEHIEKANRTLFTLVKTEREADLLIEATKTIVGDLDLPNNGILAVIPAIKVLGLNKKKAK